MNKKTKDKMISYRGQMIDVGAGSMGDWSSICSIPKNPTNPIMAWGKTEQEAIENIKPKIDKVLSNKTKDAAKLALDSLAKLKTKDVMAVGTIKEIDYKGYQIQLRRYENSVGWKILKDGSLISNGQDFYSESRAVEEAKKDIDALTKDKKMRSK